jgi:hypothetical protein
MDVSATSVLRTDTVCRPDETTHNSPSSKLKTYGFIIAIIVGIGGLAVGGAGVAGYFHVGALSNMAQIDAIIMMAVGGGGGITLLIVGIVGTVKNRKTDRGSEPSSENRGAHSTSNNSGIGGVRQTEFIVHTSKGTIRDAQRFGQAQWKTYFGDIGDEPSLPDDIDEILHSTCPFSGNEDTKVKDTHMLVLIPATVDGEKLTLDKLEQLIPNSKEGNKATYRSYGRTKDEHGRAEVGQSHWVLMTRDILPGSRNKTYNDQKELVQLYSDQDYVVPDAIEAAVCILMEFVASGVHLYPITYIPTYTRCAQTVEGQYPVVVGGFGFDGLLVRTSDFDDDCYGIAALRRF